MPANHVIELLDKAVETINSNATNNTDAFKAYSPGALIDYAKEVQAELVKTINANEIIISTDTEIKLLDADHINELEQIAIKGCQMVMRHGGQDSGETLNNMKDAVAKKIIQMQPEHNTADPITALSALEFVSSMIICKWLQIKHFIDFSIHTSANMRASQPALSLIHI